MVSIFKDIPIDGVKIVPCRVNGPRGIVKSFLVTGNERLISDPETANESVRRLIAMNLDLERLLVGHGTTCTKARKIIWRGFRRTEGLTLKWDDEETEAMKKKW